MRAASNLIRPGCCRPTRPTYPLANGQPFFILNTSDRGRLTAGTVPLAAVAGFNPVVVAGKLVASNSGIADITQQQRLAGEISAAVSQAINQHVPPQAC